MAKNLTPVIARSEATKQSRRLLRPCGARNDASGGVLTYLLVGLVLAAGLVGAVYFLRSRQPQFVSSPGDAARSKGPARAAFEIVEYSDFQCPACQAAQAPLNEILIRHKEKVRLVFRHFPLAGHRWSGLAHQAAECAARQNKFWGYHDALYRDQKLWSLEGGPPLETFMRYAREETLDLDGFAGCLSNQEVSKKINQEKLTGTGLGVRSTPSFFVNGKLVVGGAALKEEMEKRFAEGAVP